jgi:hypothetical protein
MKDAIVGAVVGAVIAALVTALSGVYILGEFKGTLASDIASMKTQVSKLEAEVSEFRKDRATFKEQGEAFLKTAQQAIRNTAEEELVKFRSIQLPEAVVLKPTWYATGDTFHVLSDQVLIEITKVNFSGSTSYADFKVMIPGQSPVEFKFVRRTERRDFEFKKQMYSLDVLGFRQDSKEDYDRRNQVNASIVRVL